MPSSMRAAIYARVSTADQSCEMQLINLRDYISSRGWNNAGEYVDTGWSGTKASRPQLDRLMRDTRLRRFDAVLVWKLDRWGATRPCGCALRAKAGGKWPLCSACRSRR
jgi:putative DNA-invertase from lambdoid prophage Rac